MISLFSFARTTAFATLALGAGALLIPQPADAQGRSGFSAGGGRGMGFSGGSRSMGFSGGGRSMGFSGGGRSMGFSGGGRGAGFARGGMVAPRMAYGAGVRGAGPRAIAPGVYGARNLAYPTRGLRTAGVNTQHLRPGHRPPYYNRHYRWPRYGGGGSVRRLSLLGRRPRPGARLSLLREQRVLWRRLLLERRGCARRTAAGSVNVRVLLRLLKPDRHDERSAGRRAGAFMATGEWAKPKW